MPAFAWGVTEHPTGDFEVDDDFWEEYLYGFNALKEHGYYAPVLRQHKDDEGKGKEPRLLEDGFIYGKLVDLQKDDQGIQHVLEVPQAVKELWDEGYIEYWSPSFREEWKHPHTGEALPLSPRHVAFVSIPHQKNLGPSSKFYTLSETDLEEGLIHDEEEVMSDTNAAPAPVETNEVSLQDLSGQIATMNEHLVSLMEMIQKSYENEDHDHEEEPEMGEKEKELKEALDEARKTIKGLRAEKTRARLKQLGVEGKDMDTLVELCEADPRAYADRIVELAEARKSTGVTVLPERGTSGTAGGATPVSVDPDRPIREAIELAEAELQKDPVWKDLPKSEQSRRVVRRAKELRGEV